MSIITMPTNLMIGSFQMEQLSYDMVESSAPTGAESTRIFGPPRWKVSMSATPNLDLTQSAVWEVLSLSLRRGLNTLAVWDPVRTAPMGTLRGSPVVGLAASAGATTMRLDSAVGTLMAGDWLQIGTGVGTSQLIKIMVAAFASAGQINISFEPALRVSFAAGTPVAWDRPVFYARKTGKSTQWEYQAGNMLQSGFALDLLETFN